MGMLRKLTAYAVALCISGAAQAGITQPPGPVYGSQSATAANAGFIGYPPSPTNLSGVSLTTISNANLSSVSLPAGDWDVSGVCQFVAAASTITTALQCGVSVSSATFGGAGTYTNIQANYITATNSSLEAPWQRIAVASTTTLYLIGVAAFATSTMTASGFLHVRLAQ